MKKSKSTSGGKKPVRRRSKKATEPAHLPPAVEVPKTDASADVRQPSNNLLDSIGNLFHNPNPTNPDPNPQENHGSTGSAISGDLSPEQQAQLNAVPDTIGAGADAKTGEGVLAEPSDPMSAMLANVAFSEQDVTDTLTELFAWLADKFDSDHWILTDRQQRMLGGPTAQIVNATWDKLKLKLPDILTRWCESTPGGTAFLMAFGIVVVPKAMKQVKLSRAKRTVTVEGEKRDEQQPAPSPARKSPQPSPNGSGIPVAVGIVGSGN